MKFSCMESASKPMEVDSGALAPTPRWMDQNGASRLLKSLGIQLEPKSLQKRRVVGGSPPFRKVMGRVIYEHDELVAWAAARLANAPSVTSTSELRSSDHHKATCR